MKCNYFNFFKSFKNFYFKGLKLLSSVELRFSSYLTLYYLQWIEFLNERNSAPSGYTRLILTVKRMHTDLMDQICMYLTKTLHQKTLCVTINAHLNCSFTTIFQKHRQTPGWIQSRWPQHPWRVLRWPGCLEHMAAGRPLILQWSKDLWFKATHYFTTWIVWQPFLRSLVLTVTTVRNYGKKCKPQQGKF